MPSPKQHSKTFSFEFFPPKGAEAIKRFKLTQGALAKLSPDFFSVTFGAGGSTGTRTFETVRDLKLATGIKAVPHISCVSHSKLEIGEVLESYKAGGIDHIIALRGDLPSGVAGYSQLRYANELVAFIREQTGDHFYIEVAAYPEFHPQSNGATADLQNFKRKVEAGADRAITQYFYNTKAYYRFIDNCEKLGLKIPIVPGIMPITNYSRLSQFSKACGAEIPRWILKRLQDFGDDREAIREFGIDVVTELCAELLASNAPGLHFFTMNQSSATAAIWKNLSIADHRMSVRSCP